MEENATGGRTSPGAGNGERENFRRSARAPPATRRHARHTDRSRKARNAKRQLEALGYDVIMTLREDAA